MTAELSDILARTHTLTFDCYGTLVDWETGLRTALARGTTPPPPEFFDAYLEQEAAVESGPYLRYRDVVRNAVLGAAARLGFPFHDAHARSVGDSVGDWPVFPDTRDALLKLSRRFRLGILSNVDRDLLARTIARIDLSFDFLITAEDVRSYKPAEGHFRRLIDLHGGARGLLHVAQSVYHDGVPARRLGLPFIWINRRGERRTGDAAPLAEFADLRSFADQR